MTAESAFSISKMVKKYCHKNFMVFKQRKEFREEGAKNILNVLGALTIRNRRPTYLSPVMSSFVQVILYLIELIAWNQTFQMIVKQLLVNSFLHHLTTTVEDSEIKSH
jgi:hypothetical protein